MFSYSIVIRIDSRTFMSWEIVHFARRDTIWFWLIGTIDHLKHGIPRFDTRNAQTLCHGIRLFVGRPERIWNTNRRHMLPLGKGTSQKQRAVSIIIRCCMIDAALRLNGPRWNVPFVLSVFKEPPHILNLGHVPPRNIPLKLRRIEHAQHIFASWHIPVGDSAIELRFSKHVAHGSNIGSIPSRDISIEFTRTKHCVHIRNMRYIPVGNIPIE